MWKHSNVYGDDDLDSVLLGGGLSAVQDGFDPFAEGMDEADGISDTGDGDTDSAIIYDRSDSFGRLGGIYSENVQNDGEPIPGPGLHPAVIGAEERRTREATDAGIGNVGRIADQRGGNVGTGVARRTRSEGVASSIGEAAKRIRTEARIPLSDDERNAAIDSLDGGTKQRYSIKRTYTRSIITDPPTFKATSFEAMMMGLKSNTNGDWIVTFKVPNEYVTQATSLGKAYGLALQVSVDRKTHDTSGHS